MKRTALLLLALFAGAAQAGPVAHKDLDGDGQADVVWRNSATGENYLYPMNGTQVLPSEGYLRTVPDAAWALAGAGDFDGNGTADLLWRHGATGKNYIYFMDGALITAEGYLRTVADTAWKVAGIGDFDQDGKDDILWRNAGSGENYLFPMDGLAIKATEGYVRTVSDAAWQVAAVGDTDADGKADIVWRNATNGQNYLFRMSGTAVMGEGYIRTVADQSWKIVGSGDFNGGGTADLLWRHSLTGENYLFALQGAAIVAEGYLRTVADAAWRVAMTADFNGDGRADILWRNAATGDNYLYFMNGTVISGEGYTRRVAGAAWQVMPSRALHTTWSASARVSNLRNSSSYEMFTPSVALTGQNVGFVAWNEMTGTCGRIWANRNANGTWGVATEVGTTQAIEPYVAANSNGDAIAVWVEREFTQAFCGGGITGNEVWANRYSAASGTWSGATRISVDAPADFTIYAFSPVATLDDAGRATVIWIQDGLSASRSVWYSRFDGAWSSPALLSNGTRVSHEPALQRDAGGNVFAVWRQDTNPYDPGQTGGGPILPNIWAARFDAAAGAWNTPQRIGNSDLSGFDGCERPRLAVNTRGDAVVIWQEARGADVSIVGTRFVAAAGAWSAPGPLEANSQPAYWPAVALDGAGNAQAAWVQKINGSETNYSGYTARMSGATGTWSAPVLFEQGLDEVSSPKVGMDDTGRALIAWHQILSGKPPVHAAHYDPANGFGAPAHFPGDSAAVAVNPGGTALLASEASSFEGTYFGISIRAAVARP